MTFSWGQGHTAGDEHWKNNWKVRLTSTETRDPWKRRKRAKQAKTCELLLLFVCGFFLILADLQGVISAVWSMLVSAVEF